MNTFLRRELNDKTRADQAVKLLQLSAADALRTGNYAEMFKLDRLANERRIKNHNHFFETSLKAITTELKPSAKSKQTEAAVHRAETRRVFRVMR